MKQIYLPILLFKFNLASSVVQFFKLRVLLMGRLHVNYLESVVHVLLRRVLGMISFYCLELLNI